MKHVLSPCLAAFLGLTGMLPASLAAADVADRSDVKARAEAFVAGLQAGDMHSALKAAMSAEQWAEAQSEFEASKAVPEAEEGMPAPQDPLAETAENLASLANPDERAEIVASARPQLEAMDLNQNAMMVGMGSGMLSMKLNDPENPLPPPSQAAVQELINIVTAVAAWMPTSKMNEEPVLVSALDILGAKAEEWPAKTPEALRALSFQDMLGFYGHFKPAAIEAAALYSVDLQATIDGMKIVDAGEFNGLPAQDLIIPVMGQPLTVTLAWELNEAGEPEMSGARMEERFAPLADLAMGMAMGMGGGGPGPGPGMGGDDMPPGM
jgi:hypothetical protein